MKNNLKLTLSFFILSLVTLVSSVFAWVSLSIRANIDGPGGNIDDYTDLVVFEVSRVSRPELGWEEIKDDLDMMVVFGETRPGEEYTFKITVDNDGSNYFDFYAVIVNVGNDFSGQGNSLYDIRDVFYITSGEINVEKYQGSTYLDGQTYQLVPSDLQEVIKYEQTLNLYRLSNLVNNNDISLTQPPFRINPGETIVMTFTLVYDANTSDINYQHNKLTFDGIYLYGQ